MQIRLWLFGALLGAGMVALNAGEAAVPGAVPGTGEAVELSAQDGSEFESQAQLNELIPHCGVYWLRDETAYGLSFGSRPERKDFTGLSCSWGEVEPHGTVRGISLGTGEAVLRHYGIQMTLCNLTNRQQGLQLGGLANLSKENTGVQLAGLVNVAAHPAGVQLAAFNAAGYGLRLPDFQLFKAEKQAGDFVMQLGLQNSSNRVPSFQFGIINDNGDAGCFQLGLFNCKRSSGGFQLGLINYSDTGLLPWMPLFNW